jgi:hypothetical protein
MTFEKLSRSPLSSEEVLARKFVRTLDEMFSERSPRARELAENFRDVAHAAGDTKLAAVWERAADFYRY